MELGLIGRSLKHSFSGRYFREKFTREGLRNYRYRLFELSDIDEFPDLLAQHPKLKGLNITIPFKRAIMPFLNSLHPEAKSIGAVNTLVKGSHGWVGFNTDHYGFAQSLTPLLEANQNRALVLGTGGAARAVIYALRQLGIDYALVSRNPGSGQLSYAQAGEQLSRFPLVINTTPLGTFPAVHERPALSLQHVSKNHLFYDLIYNPAQSLFLAEAKARGARVKNGAEMLQNQAERAWQIWHEH